MAIKVLLRDKLDTLDVLIEHSDSGKIFFGLSRADPKSQESLTFDSLGRLLEIYRDSIVKLDDGREASLYLTANIDHEKEIISYFCRGDGDSITKVHFHIFRAYKTVQRFRDKLQNDTTKLYSTKEILDYLCNIVSYYYNHPKEEKEYSIVKM